MAQALRKLLEKERFVVDVAMDGEEGARLAKSGCYDLIILDRVLPRKDGMTLLCELRQSGNMVPVLVLSVMGAVKQRVAGLQSGADDYLPKPFAPDELIARVHALARRTRAQEKAKRYQVADLALDVANRRVTRAGQPIRLSRQEFDLLLYLVQHRNQVCSRVELLDYVWGVDKVVEPNALDKCISRLRQKVDDGFGQILIQTVHGTGYVLKA